MSNNNKHDKIDDINHYKMLLEKKMSYKTLLNSIPNPHQSESINEKLDEFLGLKKRQTLNESVGQVEDDPEELPQHLQAKTTDERFHDPVRLHGVEGVRDLSQPGKATKKWRLELGPDGRPAVVSGEQAEGGMKLSYDYENGVVMVPKEEPTVKPEYKPFGQRHYPGRR